MKSSNEAHCNKVLIVIIFALIILTITLNKRIVERDTTIRTIMEENNLTAENVEHDMDLRKIKNITNHSLITYRFGQYQKSGQTFEVEDNVNLKGIELDSSFGVGNAIHLTVYEIPLNHNTYNIESGKILGQSEYEATQITRNNPFIFIFDESFSLQPHKKYAFVVETKDEETSVTITFTNESIYNDGSRYSFTRPQILRGTSIPDDHIWYSKGSEDIFFKLHYKQ